MEPIRPNQAGFFMKLLGDNIRIFVGALALGNSTEVKVGMIRTSKGVFIGVENYGAYEFHQPPAYYYVMAKLGVHEHDARNLADFLADQFLPNMARQGNYNPVFCKRHEDIDVEA